MWFELSMLYYHLQFFCHIVANGYLLSQYLMVKEISTQGRPPSNPMSLFHFKRVIFDSGEELWEQSVAFATLSYWGLP